MHTHPFWRQVLRTLYWLVLLTIALVLCLVAALWWTNRHDDPLLPEVAQAQRFEAPSPEAMQRNGYFTLLGLGAPAGEDAGAAGQRFFAAQVKGSEHYHRTRDIRSFVGEAYPHQPIRLGEAGCANMVDDCSSHYLSHAEALRAQWSTQAYAVQRYLSLQDAPVYEEILPPYVGVDFAYFGDTIAVAELVGARAAWLLAQGQVEEGLALLGANARIHRRLMEGSRTLVSAMVALAIDMRQQRLVSSLLSQHPSLANHAERINQLLLPLAAPLAKPLEGDMKFSLEAFDPQQLSMPLGPQADPSLKWLDALMTRAFGLAFLPNATLNLAYLGWHDSIRLAGLPADQLTAAAAQASQRHAAAIQGIWPLPYALRNLSGNIVIGMADPGTHVAYIERAHDAGAHSRLARLQAAVLRERVPPARMPVWLAAQPPELRNPYTLQPMGWDAATQSLVFEGRQPQNQNTEPRNVYRVRLAPSR